VILEKKPFGEKMVDIKEAYESKPTRRVSFREEAS
jgi:hypothetical protein